MRFAAHDLTGDVTPRAVRQQDTRNPPPLPEIEVIERAGPHPDQHFAETGLGVRYLFVAKHLEPAVFVEPHDFHLLISL